MTQPDTWHRQAFLPSLLDRLMDDAPSQRSERPEAYAPNADAMRGIVQRDLSLLLNTTSLDDEIDAARHPAAAASVINYGMPALSGGYLTDRSWEDIEKLVRTAITRFEPRLIPESLRILPDRRTDPLRYNKLTLEIHGLMHWSPYPFEFQIQSTFDFETNNVTLDTGARGRN
ncbi:type VI secretion system baseplate subunit TssE [Paraburkholderia caballeronis]|uniref:Type VI secretion system protein ImpF n=1 Tax=Paraburkholderia caballeronis TaxID=416943 RepID=A0A1H7FQ97_9BURK|nr:type VI secretion system baseplate subunit TssE [Paraburkholderia caballeronis]PXW24950.1 type VI secretion system protein ImpF [Paraburkholderia caballeronis]PXX00680.1 type VI secretion system protein ImpF [Paraburkholderia caballeronis]RAJ98743.1 type VI secretion system protein ImpF [Paraburkholderia caballeronis]TDV16440.1 type VI secretion system protein ImpF [Paraburkholderia caballeronis]TDV18836.1 type VI secretion system protein ImpF [Paraburkholderia caballeronis]